MRVAIAKDVIARVDKIGQIAKGGYIDIDGNFCLGPNDLQEYVDEIEPYCTVCALGSILLSKARLYNNVPTSNFEAIYYHGGRPEIVESLKDIFPIEQLDLIESAFEKDLIFSSIISDSFIQEIKDAAMFGSEYKVAKDRLVAIMENIIENNGEFIPA